MDADTIKEILAFAYRADAARERVAEKTEFARLEAEQERRAFESKMSRDENLEPAAERAVVTKEHVLAGNFTFTISCPDGEHRTYKINRAKPSDQYPGIRYFAKMLTGPNNTEDYTYLGRLDADAGKVVATAASKLPESAFPLRLLNRVLARMWARDFNAYLSAGYNVLHEGYCCRCGRPLTVPESIQSGIGPECRKHVNAF